MSRGKPDAEGYLTGAEGLGFLPGDCVVFEDAPPGIAAAKAAGMRVIGVLTTHAGDLLCETEAQIPDFRGARVSPGDDKSSLALYLSG